jgi:cation transporter-like permease
MDELLDASRGAARINLLIRRLSMPLINVVIVLIVVGVLLWLVNNYLPMDGKIKSILNAVVVICVVLWLLQAFGVLGSLSTIRVGK